MRQSWEPVLFSGYSEAAEDTCVVPDIFPEGKPTEGSLQPCQVQAVSPLGLAVWPPGLISKGALSAFWETSRLTGKR